MQRRSGAWKSLLKQISLKFSTPQVSIDTTVANPGRLARLPGTWNAKGPNTPERPHRLCRVLSYPKLWLTVEHGSMIHKLACKLGFGEVQHKQARRKANRPGLKNDLSELIYRFAADFPEHIQIEDENSTGERTFFYLGSCPFAGYRHGGDPRNGANPDRRFRRFQVLLGRL